MEKLVIYRVQFICIMDRTYLRSISGFLYMRSCFYFWLMNVISGLAAYSKSWIFFQSIDNWNHAPPKSTLHYYDWFHTKCKLIISSFLNSILNRWGLDLFSFRDLEIKHWKPLIVLSCVLLRASMTRRFMLWPFTYLFRL